jgi:tetratricopeptide (TPR) repeat protein
LRGDIAAEDEQLAYAATCYERAAELDREDAEAWTSLGSTRFELGDFEAAASAFAGALRVDPEDDDMWMYHGNCLGALGRPADAAASFGRAVACACSAEAAARTRLARGHALFAAGRFAAALADYENALARGPDIRSGPPGSGEAGEAGGEGTAAVSAPCSPPSSPSSPSSLLAAAAAVNSYATDATAAGTAAAGPAADTAADTAAGTMADTVAATAGPVFAALVAGMPTPVQQLLLGRTDPSAACPLALLDALRLGPATRAKALRGLRSNCAVLREVRDGARVAPAAHATLPDLERAAPALQENNSLALCSADRSPRRRGCRLSRTATVTSCMYSRRAHCAARAFRPGC